MGTVTRSTSYTYYPSGDVSRITFPDGSFYNYSYDEARRLAQITHDDDAADLEDVPRRSFTYDMESNLNIDKIWDIVGAWVRNPECGFNDPPGCSRWTWEESEVVLYKHYYDYDSLNRLRLEEWSETDQEVGWSYYRNGQLKETLDGFGRATTFALDGNNELDTTTYRDNGMSDIDRDAAGNISSVTDPVLAETTYERDGFGQAWKITSPASGESLYEYDEAGNLKKKTDARGVVLLYDYDGVNRLKSVTVEGESTPRETYEYDTDRDGYLYRVTDEAGTHTFLRNQAGEITLRTSVVSGSTLTTAYTYDASGRLDLLSYPSGLIVDYDYDTLGKVEKITASGANLPQSDVVTSISHRAWGPIASFTFGNGETRAYAHDEDYELTSLTSGTNIDRDFTRDLNGNIEAFDDRSYTYDLMDRLATHGGPDGAWEYEYDLNGNRTLHKENAVPTDYNYNPVNPTRLDTLSGGTTQSRYYDDNGNTVEIDGRYFDHDELNRFWRYRDGGLSVVYKHDAFGARASKNDGTTETLFVYDGPRLLHEDNGSTPRDYIYLQGEVVGLVQGGALYAVHNDHLGRPEYVTDASKTVKWDRENNAFNGVPGMDLIGGLNIGFPGQYYDIESGTYYNYFRIYDAEVGRYLQSDPEGLSDGMNTYGYAYQNPLLRVDPLGLQAVPFLDYLSCVSRDGTNPKCRAILNKQGVKQVKGAVKAIPRVVKDAGATVGQATGRTTVDIATDVKIAAEVCTACIQKQIFGISAEVVVIKQAEYLEPAVTESIEEALDRTANKRIVGKVALSKSSTRVVPIIGQVLTAKDVIVIGACALEELSDKR